MFRRRAACLIGLALLAGPGLAAAERQLPPQGARLSEERYDALLRAGEVGFDDGATRAWGAVALRVETLDETRELHRMLRAAGETLDGRDLRELGIDVKLGLLPNLNLGDRLVTVNLDRIWTTDGVTSIDGEKPKTAPFRLREVGPELHLHGHTVVLVPEGVETLAVLKVQGTLLLRLPLEVGWVEFDAKAPSGPKTLAGLSLRLVEASPDSVTFGYEGPIDHFLTVVALDDAGSVLPSTGYSVTGGPIPSDARQRLLESGDERAEAFLAALEQKRIVYRFAKPVSTVRVVVAADFAEREYGFQLGR